MSKSVLVIDTPEHGCISCLIGQNHSNSLETCIYCPIAEKCVLDKEAEAIPDWCPLVDLPKKKIMETIRLIHLMLALQRDGISALMRLQEVLYE